MTEENAIPNWLKMGLAILGAAWLTWAGLDGLTTEGAHLRGGRGGPWELKVVVMFVGAAALPEVCSCRRR